MTFYTASFVYQADHLADVLLAKMLHTASYEVVVISWCSRAYSRGHFV